jgi:hypothetical protein
MRTGDPPHSRSALSSSNVYGDFSVLTRLVFVAGNNRTFYFDFSFARMDALHIHLGPRAYEPLPAQQDQAALSRQITDREGQAL